MYVMYVHGIYYIPHDANLQILKNSIIIDKYVCKL